MVHQSNVYFEQCHGADYDPDLPPELRRACWAAWLEHYQIGQPPHRIAHAQKRIAALDAGEPVAPLPGLTTASVDATYTAAFFSTSVDVDNPADDQAVQNVETLRLSGVLETETPPPPTAPNPQSTQVRSPPNADGPCSSVCEPAWNRCMLNCEGRDRSCDGACEAEHRVCMRGCF